MIKKHTLSGAGRCAIMRDANGPLLIRGDGSEGTKFKLKFETL